MKHVFVFDPKAFYNQQWKMDNILDIIGQFFRTQESPDFSIQFSRYRRNAIGIIQEEAEKAKSGDIVRVYAIGGEEILFDCLHGVAHFPNMQLAAVPHSESNDFLKIFGHDKADTFRDIPTLVQSEALPTDAIRWGVNYALNSCYIGMNSAISKKVKDAKPQLNKLSFAIFRRASSFLNYFAAFDKQVAKRKYEIMIDDVDYSGSYCLVHVANGPYLAGRITGARDATPDDGLLDIALIKSSYPLKVLSSMRRYSRRGKRPKNCVFIQGRKISIKSENQMWIQLDNEYIQDTNIELSIVHHAVQMVAAEGLAYPMASMAEA